ncbi:MAG: HAD family hydrolase [Raoultibacter sp.]|jgi:putative hydrolase of the HAD superfamily
MIKAIFFDVGSTLIDANPDIDGVFYEKARARGHQIDSQTVSAHLDTVNRFYEKEYLKDGDFWCSPEGSVEMYLEMYRYLAHLVGLEQDADGIAQDVHDAYLKPEYWKVYSDVPGCLKALKKRHYQVGVVSNWAPNLENLLRGLGLVPYFDEIISSANVGYRKPDPVIFTLLLEKLNLKPNEVLHVGDRVDADGIGARCAGIEPIIIDRTARGVDEGYLQIQCLDELLLLIDDLRI